MPPCIAPYPAALAAAKASGEPVAAWLRRELVSYWCDDYMAMSVRPSDFITFTYGTFDYVFDAYQQPEPYDPASGLLPVEARLVAAIGESNPEPRPRRRDDNRRKGFTASAMPGTEGPWDKGHFIGHAIGGTVDGNEANVFLQLRSANRGRYREMEKYCKAYAGVTCFSRPIYTDTSAHPVRVEFGILTVEGELWVEVHPN